MQQFVILIPSYRPDGHLREVLDTMRQAGFSRFVVVDDGSGESYASVFEEACSHRDTTLLRHAENQGKGAALKTGFAHILNAQTQAQFVITVDADGQHKSPDVCKLATASLEHPEALVLGSRNFSLPHVPARSRFGNRLTSGVFRLFCGLRIGDTQTGLRSIPCRYLSSLCKILGDRYEYETNMLLETKTLSIPIHEVEIETVYIDENSSSHFNPIKDSMRIYALIFRFALRSLLRFLRFSACSLLSTLVDVVLYYLFHRLFFVPLGAVLAAPVSQAIARLLSSVCNFTLNRKLVFRTESRLVRSLVRYYALAAVQLVLSAGLLTLITALFSVGNSELSTLLKVCVDFVLFVISYKIQHLWVFREENNHDSEPK